MRSRYYWFAGPEAVCLTDAVTFRISLSKFRRPSLVACTEAAVEATVCLRVETSLTSPSIGSPSMVVSLCSIVAIALVWAVLLVTNDDTSAVTSLNAWLLARSRRHGFATAFDGHLYTYMSPYLCPILKAGTLRSFSRSLEAAIRRRYYS